MIEPKRHVPQFNDRKLRTGYHRRLWFPDIGDSSAHAKICLVAADIFVAGIV